MPHIRHLREYRISLAEDQYPPFLKRIVKACPVKSTANRAPPTYRVRRALMDPAQPSAPRSASSDSAFGVENKKVPEGARTFLTAHRKTAMS
jgi:hypothetical protein